MVLGCLGQIVQLSSFILRVVCDHCGALLLLFPQNISGLQSKQVVMNLIESPVQRSPLSLKRMPLGIEPKGKGRTQTIRDNLTLSTSS